MKISAIDYSQNINGDYKATVTGGGEGIATLIPVLNGVHHFMGKPVAVKLHTDNGFIYAEGTSQET